MHAASIKELCKSHYTADQIRDWINGLTPERYISAMEAFEFLVAEVEDEIQGLCVLDLDNAELNALYVAPWAVRKYCMFQRSSSITSVIPPNWQMVGRLRWMICQAAAASPWAAKMVARMPQDQGKL